MDGFLWHVWVLLALTARESHADEQHHQPLAVVRAKLKSRMVFRYTPTSAMMMNQGI